MLPGAASTTVLIGMTTSSCADAAVAIRRRRQVPYRERLAHVSFQMSFLAPAEVGPLCGPPPALGAICISATRVPPRVITNVVVDERRLRCHLCASDLTSPRMPEISRLLGLGAVPFLDSIGDEPHVEHRAGRAQERQNPRVRAGVLSLWALLDLNQ